MRLGCDLDEAHTAAEGGGKEGRLPPGPAGAADGRRVRRGEEAHHGHVALPAGGEEGALAARVADRWVGPQAQEPLHRRRVILGR